MSLVENFENGANLKLHRDDVKHWSRAISNKVNTENNPINDKYRHCHCTCDCEVFARQISNEYNDCSGPFCFQDRGITYPNGALYTPHGMVGKQDNIANL